MWEVLGLTAGEGDGGGAVSDGGQMTGLEGKGAYVTAQSAGSRLASADFHGAEVEVVRSRCVGRVGVRGIVVRDTKFTFEVVTRRDVVKGEFGSFFGCSLAGRNRWVWWVGGSKVLVRAGLMGEVMCVVIPKEHTIFRFEIPQPPGKGPVVDGAGTAEGEAGGLRNLVFELHGSQFENRAPERATKKFKQRNMSDL